LSYASTRPVVLSASLPMLERMGVLVLTEHPAQITPDTGVPVWIHDFELQASAGLDIDRVSEEEQIVRGPKDVEGSSLDGHQLVVPRNR